MATAKTLTMDDLLANEKVGHLTQGEVVDGTIMSVRKHEVLIDLGPLRSEEHTSELQSH